MLREKLQNTPKPEVHVVCPAAVAKPTQQDLHTCCVSQNWQSRELLQNYYFLHNYQDI